MEAIKQQKKKMWVKASIITELTIFNNAEKMRRARDYGYIQYKVIQKKDSKSFEYDLNSINDRFFKK